MIFVTVGSQLPFDRLVKVVDAWADRTGRSEEIFAQISAAEAPPRSIRWTRELSPTEFNARIEEAAVVVGHAGTGTIMAALCAGKPVVSLARRVGLGETRNDHQVATINRFHDFDGFRGSTDEADIPALIEASLASLTVGPDSPSNPGAKGPLGPYARGPLVDRLRAFLDEAL